MDFKAIRGKAEQLGLLPLPALAMGSALAWQGLVTVPAAQIPIDNAGRTSGGLFKFSNKMAKLGPSRLSCLAFAGTNFLGAWMMYDGDELNAAGFNFSWLLLYMIVNARGSVKSILHGRVSPLALSVLATGNAFIYGKKFFWK